MKNLESFKKDLFAKELTKEQIKSVRGSLVNDTGTHPTSTYSNGQYQGQDCADHDGKD